MTRRAVASLSSLLRATTGVRDDHRGRRSSRTGWRGSVRRLRLRRRVVLFDVPGVGGALVLAAALQCREEGVGAGYPDDRGGQDGAFGIDGHLVAESVAGPGARLGVVVEVAGAAE